MKPSESFEDSVWKQEDRYLRQRKLQIRLILISYSLTMLLRIIWTVLSELYSNDNISCTIIDQASILNSPTLLGNITMMINSVGDLIPHFLLPIALYVIPAPRFIPQNTESLNLDVEDYREIEDIPVDEDLRVRKKLSILISTNSMS